MDNLVLGFSILFQDLYSNSGLNRIDQLFLRFLEENDQPLLINLLAARKDPIGYRGKQESDLMLALAPHLEDFLSRLFPIKNEVTELALKHNEFHLLYKCKRNFIQRKVVKKYNQADAEKFDIDQISKELISALDVQQFDEQIFATKIELWEENNDQDKLDLASKYAACAIYTEQGRKYHHDSILFKIPTKLDMANLVETIKEEQNNLTTLTAKHSCNNTRAGFALTDNGANLNQALDQAHYCIYCHNQGKDSCSKGFREVDNSFKKNSLDANLTGCPLEEKISEMNNAKSQGYIISALAIAIVDNPMLAATGHRICNDCMKSCIYQKQQAVNIPQIETRVLKDVLELPWGFEIYSLLTRWNPFNFARFLPKEKSNYKVLIAGLGPAGFTLAHHLLNEGHQIVAVDGLKIEPLPADISGIDLNGQRTEFLPILNVNTLFEELDKRSSAGFGGVAEYGITVRWNKNFLKIIRLLLERRDNFNMYGGVRFGSSINYSNAWELGFDHIALATGSGKPNLIEMKNRLAKGVRTASDFLMALQLSGAAKENSLANLQIRLPILVVGGGLTAIDAATESLAYYAVQVEKFLSRYEKLVAENGIEKVRAKWNKEDQIIAEEFIQHALLLREEKKKIHPNIIELMNSWGGSQLVYRGAFTASPSYRLNHEEVELAMQEGIKFIEHANPIAVELDEFNSAMGLRIKNQFGEEKIIPAKTILVAAGTSPNTVLAKEEPDNFLLDGKYFQAIDDDGNKVIPEKIAKPNNAYVLNSINSMQKAVSFFGDLHPSFAGNVVKAMASAKRGYPVISKILSEQKPSDISAQELVAKLDDSLRAKIEKIILLSDNIVEIVVYAPLAAKAFQPGQFYRLQNYDYYAADKHNTKVSMEGLALTGASADSDKGTLSLIVLEIGASSKLCRHLKEGENVILMGPTGMPTHIAANENVMLVGGGLGNAVLFSIGKAFRNAGSKVLYFAGYREKKDRYKIKEIEQAADQIIWCCDQEKLDITRDGDHNFHGNIIEAINAYAQGKLGSCKINLSDIDRIITIGSDKMMQAVNHARNNLLKPYLKENHLAIASINSPMQCMMKEICAQCIQRHIDPETGQEKYVYSCYEQDQYMNEVDFDHLATRLAQNSLQEKISDLWLEYCQKN